MNESNYELCTMYNVRCRDVAHYVSTQKPNHIVIARRNDEAIADTGRDCFVPRNDGVGDRNDG
jgi:hypothetical protein